LGDTMELFGGDGCRLGRISHRENDPNNQDNHIDIRLPHTDNTFPWKIEISVKSKAKSKTKGKGEGEGEIKVPFHAWIEQSERGLAWFEGTADPRYTLGSISCGNGTLTVGAFDTFEKASLAPPFEASSAGPIRETAANDARRPELRLKPELSAPGVSIVAARAQGGVTTLSGTSMAAPHVTGLIALLFQFSQQSGRGRLSFAKTCEILAKGIKRLETDKAPVSAKAGQQAPARRLGEGRVNGPMVASTLIESVVRSVSLELKLTSQEIQDFISAHRSFDELFVFLNNIVRNNGHNGDKVADFVEFFRNRVGKEESFRLSMDYLS
jgi:hypothetical protein